jgi:hypothetical protein
MARTIEKFTATNGRDKGKVFILTEMSARAGHKWATRALMCMGPAAAKIPGLMASHGVAGLAMVGLEAFVQGIPVDQAEALLDELMGCVTINHTPENPNLERALMADSDIEEIETIFSLQKAVFLMHTRPFTSAALSISESAAASVQS